MAGEMDALTTGVHFPLLDRIAGSLPRTTAVNPHSPTSVDDDRLLETQRRLSSRPLKSCQAPKPPSKPGGISQPAQNKPLLAQK